MQTIFLTIKKAIFFAVIAFACSGCITKLERTRFLETCVIDGVAYDVHTGLQVKPDTQDPTTKVKILVPKGVKPTMGNAIALCSASRSNEECKKVFRTAVIAKIRLLEDDNSSDY